MKTLFVRGLGLSLGLLVGAAHAEEIEWRPAGSAARDKAVAVSPVEKPVAARSGPAASLGRPRAASADQPLATPKLVDQQVFPASFQQAPPEPPKFLVRGQDVEETRQVGEARPMPQGQPVSQSSQSQLLGAPQKLSPIPQAPEEPYNQGVVTQKPGSSMVSEPLGTPTPMTGPALCDDGNCGGGASCAGGVCCDGGTCCDDGFWSNLFHCNDVFCCDGVPYGSARRFWISGEYLVWQINKSHLPPLVTTSPASSLGVLGMPGTDQIFGGSVFNQLRSGGRFTLGLWLDQDQDIGIDTSFLFLAQRSKTFSASSGGIPVLARPFFNILTGAEDAELVANPAVASLPNLLPLSGSINISESSTFWGNDLNSIWNITKGCWGRFDFIAGFRYFDFREKLNIGENLNVPADSPLFGGANFLVNDEFKTRNQFYGEQIGFRTQFRWRRWSWDINTLVALGVTHQAVDINGSTVITPPGGPSTTFAGGLLAQPTNIGHYSQDKFTAIPQVGVNMGYQFTPHIRALVGYNFIYWSNVARAAEQIDRGVNVSQLPPGTLIGPQRPAFNLHDTSLFIQGVNLGLEFTW